MIGMVTRMTAQKGLDIVAEALDAIMALGVQLVMLSSGDPALEQIFLDAEQRYPDRMRVILGFDDAMAHRIQAAANIFLMPSQFEPCGLTQMYALKYGTVPVVRATGGLCDTIAEFDPKTMAGNGFLFTPYTRRGVDRRARTGDRGVSAAESMEPADGQLLQVGFFVGSRRRRVRRMVRTPAARERE